MTQASTASASGTDAFSAGLAKLIGNQQVTGSIGNAIGTAVNAGLGLVGLKPGETPEQAAARIAAAAKAKADAERKTMLIIGGAVAAIILVVVVIVMRKK